MARLCSQPSRHLGELVRMKLESQQILVGEEEKCGMFHFESLKDRSEQLA